MKLLRQLPIGVPDLSIGIAVGVGGRDLLAVGVVEEQGRRRNGIDGGIARGRGGRPHARRALEFLDNLVGIIVLVLGDQPLAVHRIGRIARIIGRRLRQHIAPAIVGGVDLRPVGIGAAQRTGTLRQELPRHPAEQVDRAVGPAEALLARAPGIGELSGPGLALCVGIGIGRVRAEIDTPAAADTQTARAGDLSRLEALEVVEKDRIDAGPGIGAPEMPGTVVVVIGDTQRCRVLGRDVGPCQSLQ